MAAPTLKAMAAIFSASFESAIDSTELTSLKAADLLSRVSSGWSAER